MNGLRRAWKRLRAHLKRIKGQRRLISARKSGALRLVVGASGVFESGWHPTEMEYLNLLVRKDWDACLETDSVDAILAEHVWEHLTEEQGSQAAKNCFEFLKPGGYLRIAVPDQYHPSPAYYERAKPGGLGAGADDHKVFYNHDSLSEMLTEVGFQIHKLEYFDRDGEFHEADWSPKDGMIHRSRRFDPRHADGDLEYASLIIDASKAA